MLENRELSAYDKLAFQITIDIFSLGLLLSTYCLNKVLFCLETDLE